MRSGQNFSHVAVLDAIVGADGKAAVLSFWLSD